MRPEIWIYTVPLRMRSLLRRRQVERDLDEELEFHQAMLVHEGKAVSHEVERSKEDCRDMRKVNPIDNLGKDFTYAVRMLRQSPWFGLTAVLTIALGIGGATAIFSVTRAVLLCPLPYREADRLTMVFRSNPASPLGTRNILYSNADFYDLKAGTKAVFEEIGGVAGFRAFVPREDGSMEQIGKALVTANFFRLMGARMTMGRDFTEGDAAPVASDHAPLIPAGSAAILSYEYWQRRYGGSAAVIGSTMPGGPVIVGVLEPGFRLYFPAGVVGTSPEFWVANNGGYDAPHRNLMLVGAVARLKDGITLRQAQERIQALTPELSGNSFDRKAVFQLQSMQDYLVEDARPAILALMGAVIFLLLIACANVANLLLVRASERERELAVRAALGGSRWRIVRQLLAEALLLSGLGTVCGAGMAWAGVKRLPGMAPGNLPRIESTTVDWMVLGFAAGAGLISTVLFGLLPAMRAVRPDVIGVLRGASLGYGGVLRKGVVVGEAALSVVLLVGSGLMFRSFLALQKVDPGYDPHGILTFYVTRDWPIQKQEGRHQLLREMQERLAAIPGVESVSAGLGAPLASTATGAGRNRDYQQVLPAYFETLRTHLVEGRFFTANDDQRGRNLVVVDDLLAAHEFPGQTAVGKRIAIPFPETPWAEVIGVVRHQRLTSLRDPGRETLYFSEGFAGIGVSRYWMVRTAGDPARYAAPARAELAKIDRGLVMQKVATMDALVERDQAGTRFSAWLLGLFAATALLLASVGLYGVLASAVRQRTPEIGVRMALGAAPAGICRLVVGEGLRLSVAGIALGLTAALGLTRLMASMLVGVRPMDPLTLGVVAMLFLAISAIASWLPARRAAATDPSRALRD